jgi:hypothetical protein
MLIQVREIHHVPDETIVHYFSWGHERQSFAHALFCGSSGYNFVHSTMPKQVTCKRCLDKLRSCNDRRFANDPNVTMTCVMS